LIVWDLGFAHEVHESVYLVSCFGIRGDLGSEVWGLGLGLRVAGCGVGAWGGEKDRERV